MMGHEESDLTMAAALEAYRAAAHAEADAHFDERALEGQRARILQRLELAGQRARVLPFPGATASPRPATPISRRWISAAAVAGLLIGLATGQLLHVLPGDSFVHRQLAPGGRGESRASAGPALVSAPAVDPDNALLDAVELAVTGSGASELRALHDLTFAYEPY